MIESNERPSMLRIHQVAESARTTTSSCAPMWSIVHGEYNREPTAGSQVGGCDVSISGQIRTESSASAPALILPSGSSSLDEWP